MNVTDIVVDSQQFDLQQWQTKEWIITNGLGGYASGTLLGDLTRRYHGLMVANLANPKGRHLMISRYVEEIEVGETKAVIGAYRTSREQSAAENFRWIKSFRLSGNVAHWTYQVGDAVIEKSILMPHNQNTICVRYRLLTGTTAKLRLRPFFAFRRHDEPLVRDDGRRIAVTIVDQRYDFTHLDSQLVLRCQVRPATAVFTAASMDIVHHLAREHSRGNECDEHAHSPGHFDADINQNQPLAFMVTTHPHESLEFDIDAGFEAEARRMQAVLTNSGVTDPFAAQLVCAADQFLVLPASRIEETILANSSGHELRTVIAGYHWFGDWGRDTMISLDGLMLRTRRFREARATLQTFASYVADGLLPNLFPEGEHQGLYNTVDATLWYFHAIHRYLQATNDTQLLAELLPVLRSIVEHHVVGTKFGIHLDESDGLITAAAEGYQLTWMDAKVDGWVVTPRRGKPVEIQALWYNALCLLSSWTESGSVRDSYDRLAAKARDTFNKRFWNADRQCLFDVVDGPQGNDAAVRPNQMFAVSLDHAILERDRWTDVMHAVTTLLQTPYGLRTLSQDHPDYKPTYHGDLRSRDAAYHQGTVWPWLVGHFVDAQLKIGVSRAEARAGLSTFVDQMKAAGIGSISEIFDAEPPHHSHGCIAQAWSVAEVLRAWLLTAESPNGTT